MSQFKTTEAPVPSSVIPLFILFVLGILVSFLGSWGINYLVALWKSKGSGGGSSKRKKKSHHHKKRKHQESDSESESSSSE